MAKERYLDLDALLQEPGVLVFRGEKYEIPEMEVEQFIKLLQTQQAAEESDDVAAGIESMRELIGTVVPTLPGDLINKMTFRQLQSLMQFVVDDVQGGMEDEEARPTQLEAVPDKKKK